MTTAYHPDEQSVGQTAARTVAAGLAGGVIALAAWFVLHKISLPAFNTSMVTRSLATAASFVCIGVGVVLAVLWTKGKKPWISSAMMSLVPAGLVVSSIGIPLGATRLYLDGIQVDQGFRTQFLSRMTENLGHADMAYKDLPTFYPMGWFWLGGRTANVLGMEGWEVYQPFAIATLAAAAAMLTPVWRRLTGSLPTALAIATVTTAVVLTEVPEEPYAAVVAMFVPAAAVMSYRAVNGSWASTIALAVYLGISASFYTLFTAIAALTMVVLAIIHTFTKRSVQPLVHLLVTGLGSMAIAAISWGPYIWRVITGDEPLESTANHFLPIEGTYFPLPFLSFSLIGLLSMIGLIYLIYRIKDPELAALGASIGVCYLWALASMAVTLLGTSLLGFRLEVLIVALFATLGVIAISEFGLNKYTTAVAAVLAVGALQMVQNIPVENEDYIDQAYADTDGNGERADRFPPDAGRYYQEMADFIEEHGHMKNDAVIYTDEINFMAFQPFYAFNAYTSHYANPLGEFEHRNDELKQWAELSYEDPEKFTEAVDNSQWEPPVAFVFRDNGKDGLKTHIAHDIYPSQPNVRYEGLFFNPDAFEKDWDLEQFGPFAVAVRK
ncbi:arabinofuranosyltransferase [Corynebacterium lehmanniae]|uniref:Galactan 5-O-arabinofuranosyltransferase n=1 Tax=Corynebacterium lehmanniae TaxID=2913497 RepID=A0ABT4R5M9_9CORY|nr:arabinofuranosyltransferase [Corynebacterium lehmanniae]MCZ9290866.1 galactan 5-O-arabinofuranosyltransferase [Corynebacterium lehmanniae]